MAKVSSEASKLIEISQKFHPSVNSEFPPIDFKGSEFRYIWSTPLISCTHGNPQRKWRKGLQFDCRKNFTRMGSRNEKESTEKNQRYLLSFYAHSKTLLSPSEHC